MRYYFESQQEGRFNMLDYYKGMDISFLQEYMEKGKKTYDLDGTQIDPLKLAKKHGVNAMRLRICPMKIFPCLWLSLLTWICPPV